MDEKTREESTGIELLRKLADDLMSMTLFSDLRIGSDAWWGETRDEKTSDLLRDIADKIEAEYDKRLMPEGMEWPRFDDGAKVKVGGWIKGGRADRVCFCVSGLTILRDMMDEPLVSLFKGERVEPSKAIAADGKPLVEGETVYSLIDGSQYCLVGVDPFGAYVRAGEARCRIGVEHLTHVRPEVLDADGLPVHVGDVVYAIEDGSPNEVVKIADDGKMYLSFLGWYRPSAVRITPPDFQAAVDSDAKMPSYDYLIKRGRRAETVNQPGETRFELRERMRAAKWADLRRRQREMDAKAV